MTLCVYNLDMSVSLNIHTEAVEFDSKLNRSYITTEYKLFRKEEGWIQ